MYFGTFQTVFFPYSSYAKRFPFNWHHFYVTERQYIHFDFSPTPFIIPLGCWHFLYETNQSHVIRTTHFWKEGEKKKEKNFWSWCLSPPEFLRFLLTLLLFLKGWFHRADTIANSTEDSSRLLLSQRRQVLNVSIDQTCALS